MKLLPVFFLLIVFQWAISPVTGQTIYRTDTQTEQIKSLQVKVAEQQISTPYIRLDRDEQIEINFDALEHDYRRFAYQIIHCDADWKQSSLSPLEYIHGFQGLPLDDFATSMATTTNYTNYRLLLPNNDIQFRLSGNYAVRIYEEDQPEKTIATACFSVIDPQIDITATVSSSTTIDFNKNHQQVSFTINHKNLRITHPLTDLKIYVFQNGRRDNAVTGLKPNSILDSRIIYEHNRDLIFEAGNEYHRIEFLTHRYNGMGVEDIQFHNPYYHVVLMPDPVRSHQTYRYDQDQNGRYFPACSGCNDPDSEGDYYIVHFALESEVFLDGNVYISGELFHNILDDRSRMRYNFDTGFYEKYALLKTGNYNYQYLFVPNGQSKGSPGPTEGNYFQTENEYTIAVYYKPMGARYDQLIGVLTLSSAGN